MDAEQRGLNRALRAARRRCADGRARSVVAIDGPLGLRGPIVYRVTLRDGAFAALMRRWHKPGRGEYANQIAQVAQGQPIRWLEMSRYLQAGPGRRPVVSLGCGAVAVVGASGRAEAR